jgi:hypothetical protein
MLDPWYSWLASCWICEGVVGASPSQLHVPSLLLLLLLFLPLFGAMP